MMRRMRHTTSTQDSPLTDIERDIVWGDSPPPRRICLSTTPGRRVTRSHSTEQDLTLTDLIECVHPKENKESNTPPLLGLWMRNRKDAGSSGKKKRRAARLTRRTSSRKLSRVGLDNAVMDDLRVLTEWTGNLAAAVEEASKDHNVNEGNCDRIFEEMECEDIKTVSDGDKTSRSTEMGVDKDVNENQTTGSVKVKEDRRRSSNHSFTDDLWGSDDWYDDDSIMRIATQMETEALTQQQPQCERFNSESAEVADVISPTQACSGVGTGYVNQSVNNQNPQTLSSAGGKWQNASKCDVVPKPPRTSNIATKASNGNCIGSGGSSKVSSSWTSATRTRTQPSKLGVRTIASGVSATAGKSVTEFQKKPPNYVSKSSKVTSAISKQNTLPVAANISTASHSGRMLSRGKESALQRITLNKTATRNSPPKQWQKPIVKASTTGHSTLLNFTQTGVVPSKLTFCGTVDTKSDVEKSSISVQAKSDGLNLEDSLDDLFSDNSLPDDVLLALLDNDSDFDDYSAKASATAFNSSKNRKRASLNYPQKAMGPVTNGSRCNSAITNKSASTPTQAVSSTMQNSSVLKPVYNRLPAASCGGTNSCVAKHNLSEVGHVVVQKCLPNPEPDWRNTRMTTSAAQLPDAVVSNSIAKRTSPTSGVGDSSMVHTTSRRSLSQPVTPSSKKGGGVALKRFCSQQEIERKRQAALAKRKQRQPKDGGSSQT